MPYESESERELKRWMTLTDVVQHVRSVDQCTKEVAREQIVKALADGALGPLRWKPEKNKKPRPFGASSMVTPSDEPPSAHDWQDAEIRWKDGTVRDDWTQYGNGRWRGLLILQHAVTNVWAATKAVPPNSGKPKPGRPPEYNWTNVERQLKNYSKENGPIETLNELLQLCSNFATDGHPNKKTPDDATIRAAIKKHSLGLVAGFAPGNSPGK